MPPVPSSPSARLVGRRDEIDQLTFAASYLPDRRGALHLVTGPAGIGKTALIDRFVATVSFPTGRATASADAPEPMSPWCHAIETVMAAACPPLEDALRPALEHLGRRRPAPEAMADDIAAASAVAPFVLVLEDLQHADARSLDLLTALLPHLGTTSLMLVGSWQLDDQQEATPSIVEQWRAHRSTTVLPLAPLGPDEIDRLVSLHGGPIGRTDRQAIVAAAGGHPLVAIELAAFSRGERTSTRPLVDLVSRRLAALDDRVAVELLAVLDQPGSIPFLAEAGARGPAEVGRQLELAAHAGIVRWTGVASEPAALAHPGFAAAVVGLMSPGRLADIHERIAIALLAEPGRAEQAVRHAEVSGRADLVVSTSRLASEHCERSGAFEDALRLVGRAHTSTSDPQVRRELDVTRGRLLGLLGRYVEARAAFDAAWSGIDVADAPELAADLLLDAFAVDPVLVTERPAWLDRVILTRDALRDRSHHRLPAIQACLAAATFGADPARALEQAAAAADLARRNSGPDDIALTLGQLVRMVRSEPGGADLRLLRDEAAALPGTPAAFTSALAAARLALQCGTRDELERSVGDLQATLDSSPSAIGQAQVATAQATLAFLDGRGDDLAALLDRVRTLGAGAAAGVAHMDLALCLVWRFHTGTYPHCVVERGALEPLGPALVDLLVLAFTVIDAARSDGTAIERIGSLLRPSATIPDGTAWVAWQSLVAFGSALTRFEGLGLGHALALLDRTTEWATLGPLVPIGPVGFFVAAPLARAGRTAEALAAATDGLAAARRLGCDVWIARCALQLIELSIATSGAAPTELTHEVEALHRDRRVQLTPLERLLVARPADERAARRNLVIELVAAGLSNKEIAARLNVSRKTIERDLSHVFAATGARNRAQAVAKHLEGNTGDR